MSITYDYGMSRLFLGIPLKVRLKIQVISEHIHSAIFYLQAWEQYIYKLSYELFCSHFQLAKYIDK